MKAPDKVYIGIDRSKVERSEYIDYKGLHDVFTVEPELFETWSKNPRFMDDIEYIRKDALLEWVKLAYGKVSMNPFDCSEAFEELIDKLESI